LPLQSLGPTSWSGNGRGDFSHEQACQSVFGSAHEARWLIFGSRGGQALLDFAIKISSPVGSIHLSSCS
jgi:hypothetical protein